MLKALNEVVSKAGGNMSDASRQSILSLIDSDNDEQEVSTAITHARLLSALIKVLPSATSTPLIKNRVATSEFTKSSILNLNAVLLDSPSSLLADSADETAELIVQGIENKDPFISDNAVLAAGKYLLCEEHEHNFETDKTLFESLASVISPGHPVDTRRLALVVIRTVSRLHKDQIRPHLPLLLPPIFASVRDMVIPVKLAAEQAFISVLDVVESETALFDKYMAGAGAQLPPNTKRSMTDYFKRVAVRLGAQARERKEAEGGEGGLGLSADEADDEKEVWSIGKVDLGEGSFGDE